MCARSAVRNRRFVGIEFNDGVVDLVTGERREHMLDGVDFDVAFGERGRAIGLRDVLDARFDFRLAVEIDAPETDGCPYSPVRAEKSSSRRCRCVSRSPKSSRSRGVFAALARGISKRTAEIGKLGKRTENLPILAGNGSATAVSASLFQV